MLVHDCGGKLVRIQFRIAELDVLIRQIRKRIGSVITKNRDPRTVYDNAANVECII